MPRARVPILRLAILTCLAACHRSGAPPPPPAGAARAPVVASRLLSMQVNHTLLSFRTIGATGTPVVLVHDSYGDLDDWGAQLGAFGATHQVLVYSRRYHPPNPPQDDGQVYSPELHAEDLAALLVALGDRKSTRLNSSHLVIS